MKNEQPIQDHFSWRCAELFPEPSWDKDALHQVLVDVVADALVARYNEEHPR